MKKLLKLSAAALVIAGANVLLSQSALACTQNDPNYHSCMHHNILNPPQGNNGGYGYSSSYHIKYLGLFSDRNDKPYFARNTYISNDGYFDFELADGIGLAECNKSSKRAPCKNLVSISGNRGCIAYLDTPQVLYSEPTDNNTSCQQAKQAINNRCMARYNDPKICKGIKSKEL